MAEADDKPGKSGLTRTEEDKLLETAKKRFTVASSAENDNRDREKDDLKFAAASPDDNYQWPNEIQRQRSQPGQEGGVRPCMTVNVLPGHINQVTNEQRLNKVQMKVAPIGDGADQETAKFWNGYLRHVHVASDADIAYQQATQPQVTSGEGFFRILTKRDPMRFDQEVVIGAIPDRFKVYMDPAGMLLHPAGKMCKWGFIIEDVPEDDYHETYGEDYAVDWNDAGVGDGNAWLDKSMKTVRVAEYFVIKETEHTICLWPDGNVTIKGGPQDAAYAERGIRPVKERETRIPRCWWHKITSQRVLKRTEMPTQYIPIVRVVGNQWIIDGKPLVSGLVRNAKDAQRAYNYNISMEAELNALAPKAPITAMVEQIEGHEDKYRVVNQVPLAYLPYNAVRDDDGNIVNVAPPQRIAPVMPQAAIIQAKLSALDQIKQTTSQYDASLGQRSNETSGTAIQNRQREGDVANYHYVDNFKKALQHGCTIVLEMAAAVMTERQNVPVVGEDGEASTVVVDPNAPLAFQEEQGPDGKKVKVFNPDRGIHRVEVSTGPSFTTRRQEAAEFLTSAVSAAKDPASASTLTYIAMKNQDWAGADEAVTALKALLPPQVQQAISSDADDGQPQIPPEAQQMIDQIKQLAGHTKGQLDAAQQALQERDQKLRSLESEIKGKNMDAAAKMYDADMKALSEITRARAEVLIAQAKALEIQAQQPDNPQVQAVTQALGHFAGEMDAKIAALTESAGQIKSQLDNFEIAGRIQQQNQQTEMQQ